MSQTAKKNEKISAFLSSLNNGVRSPYPEEYRAYFMCFNARQYYEAHDVLEHLWLRETGEDAAFYKALIQIAGAFVHLRLQYLQPHHHKHGKRLRPAERLLCLGGKVLLRHQGHHLGLDTNRMRIVCESYRENILAGDFVKNPWRPETAPQFCLDAAFLTA